MILSKRCNVYSHFIGLSFICDKGLDYNLFEIKLFFIEFYLILSKKC